MPELPEVETTCRGIRPHLVGRSITALALHNRRLRWPVPASLRQELVGQTVRSVTRRAKYLLLEVGHGTLIIHLGMSGSLRLADPATPRLKHDHIEMHLSGGLCLRYCDPRRFGAWLWTRDAVAQHPRLCDLGPEPLGRQFTGKALYAACQHSQQPIKLRIMDSHTVVGVGNIYANEALYMAGISPLRPADSLSLAECTALCAAIKAILRRAIRQGGTTLRDFVGGDGQPGYFAQTLAVYGRQGEHCRQCGTPLADTRLGQRATVYCPACQR